LCYINTGRTLTLPTTTIGLPAELREQLTAHAKAGGKSQSAVIVQAIEEYLKERHHGGSQSEIDAEMRRLTSLDRQEPDHADYLEGDVDPWSSDNEGQR